jgi:hypothetical protein
VRRQNPNADGTAASATSINEYTDLKSTYIQYFGHTIDFRELIEDDLQFQPQKTEEFDYSVAGGWTEVACLVRPKNAPKRVLDITKILPVFDLYGVPHNLNIRINNFSSIFISKFSAQWSVISMVIFTFHLSI